MESIQPWIEKFIKQAQQQRSQSTKDYPTSYRNLRVKLSFGYGNFTSIPWFAFLGEGQEASNGIYPVILYYKDFDELVLAYGISDTNEPHAQWQFSSDIPKEGANKRGNTSRLTQSFHFFMFEPIFSPVNALNQPI
ncbi:hypothetical protein CA696_023270 [Escherichia coli]|nr:DUF3578 domain-containing protein [Escherichia coli]ASX07935.1 hypothetical protein CA696_023270 [Escherichia coli]